MNPDDCSSQQRSNAHVLLDRENIKAYFLVMLGISAIIALYYIALGPATAHIPPGGQYPPGPSPPDAGPGMGAFNSWPLWGQLIFPSLPELMIGIVILTVFVIVLSHLTKQTGFYLDSRLVVLIGILLIIATNLIHGWQIGIEQPISGNREIFNDIFKINDIIDFIGNYELLQPLIVSWTNLDIPSFTPPSNGTGHIQEAVW